ncbi:MAG: hypothetical protein JJE25_02250, partial [Bacteroidia bacterium]|nr:hypothetical protein [Bacteroidia bacterium]
MKHSAIGKATFALTAWMMFFHFNASGQTVIWSSGFETGNLALTSSINGGGVGTITQPVSANPNSGTNSGAIAGASGANNPYDGSIITGTTLNFQVGKYYLVAVNAAVVKCTGTLKIAKATVADNASMMAATGADRLLWPGGVNVTSATYSSKATAIFTVPSNENKYVGFYMASAGCGGTGSAEMYIDDITITEYDYPPCGYYCTAGGTSNAAGYISTVVFDAISRASTYDGYVCTGQTAIVRRTLSYNLQVDRFNTGTYTLYTEVWIDWDQNGVFSNGNNVNGDNEIVMAAQSSVAAGTVTRNASITIPAGATLGTTKMRVINKYNAAPDVNGCDVNTYTDAEDYDINILPAPVPMVYSGTNVTQITDSVNAGTTRNEVLRMNVVTTGQLSPISVTQFKFTSLGTTNIADIRNARIFFTGSSNIFSSTVPFGPIIIPFPPADPTNMTITSSRVLSEGDNYFWIVYDVVAAAPAGNVIDVQLVSTTVGGTLYTLNSSPAGNRPIIPAPPMIYVSSTVVQNTNPVAINSVNNDVIRIEVVTSGALNPFNATNFYFRTVGTTNSGDILNAKLFYTADVPTFSTTTQFGSTLAVPTASFAMNGSSTLVQGTNYFWLTYDV